jgi:hypothetical protein
MKEPVTPSPAKSLWQDMKHEQIKELFSAHSPGPVLSGLGMLVAEGDHTVLASQDVLFPDNTPVEIPPKINDGLVSVTDFLAISDPFFGAILGQFQALIDQGFQHLCPENLCQCLFIEKVSGLFLP